MRVLLDMFMILLQNLSQEFVFGVSDRLDNESIISGEIEEGSGFSRGTEFREDVFRGEGDEVVGRVEEEVFS